MRKLVVLSLIGFLILAFGTVYAQEKKEEPKLEVKISGNIWTWSSWLRNNTEGAINTSNIAYDSVSSKYKPNGDGYDKTVAFMTSRARLKFDAIYGKNASGTIFFEMDSAKWGDGASGSVVQRNVMGHWSGDRAAVEVKNVYVDFGLPFIPVPVSMRVGLQPLNIRNPVFVYTDGMGITTNIKVDPANIQLLWFKPVENRLETADDSDVYGIHGNAKIGPITAGGYFLYYNMNAYPMPIYNVPDLAKASYSADFWWLGVYADGKVGPVGLNFDFIYDRGTVERRFANWRDTKYRGWATRLKIDYPWEAFNFGLIGMYATGADTRKTDPTGLPNASGTNRKVGTYVIPPGSETFGIFTEGIVFYGSGLNNTSSGIGVAANYTTVSRGSFGGTWMAKLYGSYKATPWYKVTLQGLYIGDTTKNGNTVGTARKADGETFRDDKTIGWEFDLINDFQIFKNLTYSVGLGVLFPGDGLKYWDSVREKNDKPKTPWAVLTQLAYSF
ncbi:MAG: alginate export family protein [Candidatus Anstonellales archaeon]